jgi:anti-sigma factor RsiW
MIACAELEDLVANYLDEALPGARRRDVERHVGECRGCREFLAAYQRTVWVAKKAVQASIYSGQAPERLVQAILGSLRR